MYSLTELKTIKNGYNNLFYFTKHILGYSLLEDDIHRDACNFIQYTKKKEVVDIEPRDFFKTTYGSIGLSIWNIVQDYDIKILLNHKILSKAKAILSEIKGHFEKNEKLRYFYGDFVGNTLWRQDAIVVSKREVNSKEPTISIGGTDHESVSGHYNLIINDDLAGLRDMISEAERESTLRYYQSLKYLRDMGNWIGMYNYGTRWHLEDVHSHILDKEDIDIRIKKAIINGKPYFKSRYNMKELMKMKGDDPVMFESQMMNNPTALKDQLYPLDKLNFFDYESFSPSHSIGYVDPAFGKKEKGKPCYFSFCIADIVGTSGYIIDWPTNQDKPEQNELMMCDKIREHNIQRLAVESNAAQSEFIRNVEKEMEKQGIVLNVEPLHNAANKDRRIQDMHGTVVKSIYFRKDWAEIYPEPMRQLTLYPYCKYKDGPDALRGLVSLINMGGVPNIR